ncbi:MAG TPA: biotin--[acetyl-CoA-carboxylase] ligase, partial [Bryobacteraceae bacterium]|nr:biotin--[acetyl-CoA-carboxylase] ligase [Bryobacteraceae bacterium]
MPAIHRYASLPSTMLTASELARAGAEHGTVVVADEQTAGQGRLGRAWHSEAGTGLYATFILRPRVCPESLPLVTLSLGLAAVDAIQIKSGVTCDLRWPNDVLVREKKCAGILAQLCGGVLLAGIGCNVNQREFSSELRDIATSLRMASGQEQSRDELLDRLVESVLAHVDLLITAGKDPVLRAFTQASSYVRGKRVIVEAPERTLTGITDGLDPQGFLWLREDTGKRTLIVAGGVRP